MTRLEQLAYKLADTNAQACIECYLLIAEPGSDFYDLATVDPDDKEFIAEAVEYLELRGRIRRHEANRQWVKVL